LRKGVKEGKVEVIPLIEYDDMRHLKNAQFQLIYWTVTLAYLRIRQR